ncbi:MAG: penicillin acylase family protein [Thermoanaerobaculia bacterium]|nr:penicillin acylase family protein [Thermoanaerobaculia bacterium]
MWWREGAGSMPARAIWWLPLAFVLACGDEAPPVAVEEEIVVPGLAAEAEILVDRWGVPHIYAASIDDVFLAQGWNAARDRLWQLDLWLRRGEGRLAEVLGPDWVEQDRAARLLLYRGPMHREWLAYASDTKRIASAFVAGINAWVDRVEATPELLPPEFTVLDYRPSRWTPAAVARIRSHGLLRNARSELARALFLARHGAEALALRDHYEPEHELVVPAGFDPASADEAWLETYRLGTAAVDFGEEAEAEAALAGAPAVWSAVVPGSNNWALAPERTTTGRPILANDPHRTLALPSLRYIAHLQAPGLHVIGAGEPALPGISIGHNEDIAFGLTVFSIDQEDLYVYRRRQRDGEAPEILYRDRWEPMEEVRETIAVRGAEPVAVTLRFTRHGPVLWEDPERGLAVALRAAWLEPGMAPYLGSVEYMRAHDWDGFLAAMNRWGLPGENQVYADVGGAIGWKPGGLAPVRPNWDGLLPVPGDGRYEWSGFRDMDELPVEANPDRGWVATANQMNLPPGYPHRLGLEWAPPHRFDRIAEVLAAGDRMSVADALELQTDAVSLPARRAAARLSRLDGRSEEERSALALFAGWSGELATDSPAAALFEVWVRRYLPQALWGALAERHRLGDGAAEALAASGTAAVLRHLDRTGEEALPAEILLSSLAAAWRDMEALTGRASGWTWGDLHTSRLRHPLSARLAAIGLDVDVGPLARPGSSETVGNTSYRSDDFVQVSGASFRMVLDVGDWDRSVAMNAPGQSGDPRSPHYADLFAPWAANGAFPLLFSRPAVEAETTQRWRLLPD